MKRVTIEKPKLILGEGADEVAFFSALLKHLQINDVQPISKSLYPRLASESTRTRSFLWDDSRKRLLGLYSSSI